MDALAYKTIPKAKLALRELEIKSEAQTEAPSDDNKPKALGRVYMQAVERINVQVPEHRELAQKVLSWVWPRAVTMLR